MSIRKKSIVLFNNSHFKKRITLCHEHIVSFSCSGHLSYDGLVISITKGEAIHLPKNKKINLFLHNIGYDNLGGALTIHKYISKTFSSSDKLIVDFINAINEVEKNKLTNRKIIIESISSQLERKITNHLKYTQRKENIENIIEQIVLSDAKKNFSTQDICKKTNMSKSKLYRKLKERNIILKEFIANIKINHAKSLLIDTDLSISEISFECGFDNPSYFSNRFKLRTGTSPSSFRKTQSKS